MRGLLIAVILALPVSASDAATLRLPPALRRAPETIARQCPECLGAGFMTCGSADVAYGKRFARTALQGRPPRGYLATFVMSGDEFRRLARRSSYETLTATLRERFAHARLVVLEAPGARVLPPARDVTVTFPPQLHACVYESPKPWGCCVAADCRDECCEKSLGSPTVSLAWTDGETRESIELTFSHTTGFSQLRRKSRRGSSMYYCLVDQPARFAD